MSTFLRFNRNLFLLKHVFSALHVASFEVDVYHLLNMNIL